MNFLKKKTQISPFLWDLFCISSIAGIWPRFIEPRLISVTHLDLLMPKLPEDLNLFKILQLSDLHFNSQTPQTFLKKLLRKCQNLKPDLIVFTGDFICYSNLEDSLRLKSFLNQFYAPYGCYAILGNHDYDSFVSINQEGDYDIITPPHSSSLSRAFKRLFTTTTLTKYTTNRAKAVPFHMDLMALLKETPFQLLHNETKTLKVKSTKLNLCGLGEYCLKKIDTEKAFENYNKNYPGIVLLHNPDGIPLIKSFPGNIILCGHTHGGQVNLPWMSKKFMLLENMQFKKGLVDYENKQAYINRGLGSVLPFRWFSPPEILLLTLKRAT